MAIQHPHKKNPASGVKAKHVFKKKTATTALKKDPPPLPLPARPASAGKIFFLYVILLTGLALFEAPRLTATLADLEGSFPPAAWIAKKVQFFAEKTGTAKLSEKASLLVARFFHQDILGAKEAAQPPVVAIAGTENLLPSQAHTPKTVIPVEQKGTPVAKSVPVREHTGAAPRVFSPVRNATATHGTVAATNATTLASAPHASLKNATQRMPQTSTAAVPALSVKQTVGNTVATSVAGKGIFPVSQLIKTLLALPEPKKTPATKGTIAVAGNGTWRFMAATLLSRNATVMGNGTVLPAKPVVLLVGDSMMMEGLGPVLLRALRQRAAFDVIREAKYSTGLCRTDFFNWAEYMETLVATHNPALVIICLGANDGQDIIDATHKRHIAGTPSWEKMYLLRSEELTKAAESNGAHVVWIGLPIMGKPAHAKYIEQIAQQQKALCQNATRRLYVDTLPVLADEKGQYATFLKGADGSVTRVRYKDKVHVNIAGGQMLATYVMPYLEPLLPKDALADAAPTPVAGKNKTLPSGNSTASVPSGQGKAPGNGTRQTPAPPAAQTPPASAAQTPPASAAQTLAPSAAQTAAPPTKGNGTTMPADAGISAAEAVAPFFAPTDKPTATPAVAPTKGSARTERAKAPHAHTSGQEQQQVEAQQKRESAQFR